MPDESVRPAKAPEREPRYGSASLLRADSLQVSGRVSSRFPGGVFRHHRAGPGRSRADPSGLHIMARITISAAAKHGFASRTTLYRAVKDGRLTAHQDGDKKTLDIADLVKVFGEPGDRTAAPEKPDLAAAVQTGRLEADNARLADDVDRLRRERDQARRELELFEATQKLLEDQSRERKAKRSWWDKQF